MRTRMSKRWYRMYWTSRYHLCLQGNYLPMLLRNPGIPVRRGYMVYFSRESTEGYNASESVRRLRCSTPFRGGTDERPQVQPVTITSTNHGARKKGSRRQGGRDQDRRETATVTVTSSTSGPVATGLVNIIQSQFPITPAEALQLTWGQS